MRFTRLLIFILLCSGLGYLLPGSFAAPNSPRIEAFRASSPTLRSGETVRLDWRLSGGEPTTVRLVSAAGVLTPMGTSVQLEPKLSDTYTLVVENRQGSSQRTLRVAVKAQPNPPPAATPSGGTAPAESAPGDTATSGGQPEKTLPEGTFGVSRNPEGPFMNDAAGGGIGSANDERIARVPPGSVFFAEVRFEDPDGVAQIVFNLANGTPPGLEGALTPERPPFTLVGAPTGDCDLASLPTRVRCLYRIRVADATRNIDRLPDAGDEFAYVFRVRVIDGLGDSVNKPVRGYVLVMPRRNTPR